MSQESLPRPLVKYLASLPAEHREWLTPLIMKVQQALDQDGARVEDVLALLAAAPPRRVSQETVLIEALARLPHPLMPAILAGRYGDHPERAVHKALKKAWHHLKILGIEIAPELAQSPGKAVVNLRPEEAPVRAYVSRIEGNGSRMIILHLPGLGQPFNFMMVLADDVEGLKDAHLMPMSKKEVKLYLEHVRSEIPGELAPVPFAYAFGILEEYFQLDPQSTAEAVLLYRQARVFLRQRLGEATPPAISSLLPVLEDAPTHLERCGDLLLQEDFLTWSLELEEIEPWLEKIAAVEQSPLHLTEEQQRARYDDIMAKALQELFPPARRRLIGNRLLHMAYYYDQIERPYLARLAQAAGEDLGREHNMLELRGENRFLLGLFLLPVEMLRRKLESPEEETTASGRIVTDF
ncbi:MAG: hypothetical protein ACUVRZ_08975 [Desulfobacca sp.]|uniref:hypothetical protein n=1 Tax=Desulfobacca sp. TaxID=2067990 RepID=UPI0040492B0E